MELVIKISQLILCLTILVVLHECGHFLPARWFKTRVEKFYLFFNPWFSLFKKKIGETEWGLGWLPLGGYVKIAGMVDESFDTEQLKAEPQPWEFRSKPAWQRLIIMVGGVTVNFLLGFFIFSMLIWKNGQEFLPNSEVKYGVSVDSLAYKLGFRDGDRIVRIGNQELAQFDRNKIIKSLVLDGANSVRVIRENTEMDLHMEPSLISELTKPEVKNMAFMEPRIPAEVMDFMNVGNARAAGIQKGDRFLSVNGQAAEYVRDVIRAVGKNPNTEYNLELLRGQDTIRLSIKSNEDGYLGVYWQTFDHFFKMDKREYGFIAAIPEGIHTGMDLLSGQLKAFGKMFSGEIKAKDSLGGFASITNMFPKTWD